MSRRALTLAEVILAMGLISLLIVGSITLMTSLLASNQKTNAALAGLTFANTKLEEIAEAGSYTNLVGAQESYVMDANQGTRFYFRTDCRPLSGDLTSTSPYLGGYFLTLEVWWNADSPTRLVAGSGLRSVRLHRFFYPQVAVP